jgi:hypothetical protein
MPRITEESVSKRIAERLKQKTIPFERDVPIGGVQVDFVFRTSRNELIIAELKAWEPTSENIKRAIHQVELYKLRTGAVAAYVVIPRIKRSQPKRGLVNENELVNLLAARYQAATAPSERRMGRVLTRGAKWVVARKRGRVVAAKRKAALKRVSVSEPSKLKTRPRKIFAAMPFSAEYDDVFMIAMTSAAEKNDSVCGRVDHQAYSGDVVEQIKQMIRDSVAVIADISESRPNVLYEAGYAEALGVPTVQICSTPLDKLPFDVRNHRTIKYTKGQTFKLAKVLSRELKAILR